MEMHNVSEHGNAETYLIQSTDVSQLITNTPFAQVETMYNEGAPEFVADQGLYYPAATNYGYYCTGFGAPSDWEDQHRFFGVDGPDVQYTGMQSENMPYVYYTPSYGYAESPYNPYNPYIPGAMIGVDSPFVGAQQYYSVPSYQNSVSSAYIPVLIQPDMNSPETLSTAGAATLSKSEGRGSKNNFASASANASRNTLKNSSIQASSFSRFPEVVRDNMGQGKPAVTYGGVSAGNLHNSNSSRVLQGRGASSSIQSIDNNNNISAKIPSHHSQLKVGFSDYGSGGHGWSTVEKPRQKPTLVRVQGNVNGNADASGEQNRGPRTNRARSQLAVKAYTSRAGNSNAQGIIIIDSDQYNKDDFPVDHEDAKFFVIKSYSEDDVHKSIKYNVWSSTPHGNKKLQNAYEDAQRIAAGKLKGCPIFLFFSVNASGMFCGVAEMVGPVDFHKDMDFWQQDKWSGSFPVKWHIIKDVQNTSFRHIILENNENKPVTNSRDTQEIIYKQGLEMLKIFKNHAFKTSLLDDFMYYENRQKIMQEERARLFVKSFQSPFSVPAFDPPRKLFSIVNEQPSLGKSENKDLTGPIKNHASENEPVSVKNDICGGSLTNGKSDKQSLGETEDDVTSGLKIGSLTINPKQVDPASVSSTANVVKVDAKQAEIVTVGSMPVKVNGFNELTVGTIPLDPRVLQAEKKSVHMKSSTPKLMTKKSP